jgi:hypothetical protein
MSGLFDETMTMNFMQAVASMTTSKRIVTAVLLVCGLWTLAACGPEEPGEGGGAECQVDSDCPGFDQKCNLLTHECEEREGLSGNDTSEDDPEEDTGTSDDDPDTWMPPEDTDQPPPEDTGREDTGTTPEDTGDDDTGSPIDTGTPDTGMPDTGVPDTGTPDTGTPDTGPIDTGIVDTGRPDTGTIDTGTTDTGTTDTGTPDMGTPDSGTPSFSGCQSDLDCPGTYDCNMSLGRCEDQRNSCTTDSDCSGLTRDCVAGRCATTCNWTSCSGPGLTCKTIGSDDYCVDACDTFDGSGTQSCGPDTQCIPFFGSSEGICRGVGQKTDGQTCTDGWGPGDCTTGTICSNRRGHDECVPLCGSSTGAPSCASGEFCASVFTTDGDGNDVPNPAGFCLDNCGGLGSTSNSKCSSRSLVCNPNSASTGYCTKSGTSTAGQSCGDPGSPYCTTDNICLPTTSSSGVCRAKCDPSKSASQNSCGGSEVCLELETGYGFCMTGCSNTGSSFNNICPSDRPYCAGLSSSANTTPSSPGVCLDSAP